MSAPGAALLIDFGSTYTKLRAIDLGDGRLLASAQGPSTVATDITLGLEQALAALAARLGGLPRFAHRLASSSAAGGLRMATIGLVRDLTAEAARRAALGAGARVIGVFAHRLTRADLQRLEDDAPDIVLLAGGTDGGNRDVVLANARALAASSLACPIVYAGNRDAADEAQAMLAERACIVAANVMPEYNVLDIEPAREAIRAVFMARIVAAKGIARAQARIDAVLMPTPVAVLEGARLLADGCDGEPGLGDLIVVDPGGATTDVHSVCAGAPTRPGVVPYGLPEPRVKRTVEGDLGMRHNARSVLEAAGALALARDAGLAPADLEATVAAFAGDVERLPGNDAEAAVDGALARAMIAAALARHAGTVETVYTATGPVTMQRGKDLSAVGLVIGTGGVIAHARDPGRLLAGHGGAAQADGTALLPQRPRLLVDRDYAIYACGLLAGVAPRAALRLAKSSLRPVDTPEDRDASARAVAHS
jgi:uncharacterized protein (TIGR01319 family)